MNVNFIHSRAQTSIHNFGPLRLSSNLQRQRQSFPALSDTTLHGDGGALELKLQT